MGKLVVTEFVTLDGVMEDPGGGEKDQFDRGGWAFQFDRGEEGDTFKFDELKAADAQLLGRVTYNGFAKAWPTMEGTGEFGEKMNAMPKFVVSERSMTRPGTTRPCSGRTSRRDRQAEGAVRGRHSRRRQRAARPGAARARPRRRAAPDGVPGRARRRQAALRGRGQHEVDGARGDEAGRRDGDPRLQAQALIAYSRGTGSVNACSVPDIPDNIVLERHREVGPGRRRAPRRRPSGCARSPDPYWREPPPSVAGEAAAGESASGARMRER